LPTDLSRTHCYRVLRSANPEARFSRSVLARENPFSRPIVAEAGFVITLDGHFSYYLPGPLLAQVGCHGRGRAIPLCPGTSDVYLLGYRESVVDLNAQIAHCALNFSVP
jgi:hypothetical protein